MKPARSIDVRPARTTTSIPSSATASLAGRLRRGLASRLRRGLALLATPLAVLAALATAGCAAIDPSVYRSENPELVLERYFDGTVDGWGLFQDWRGRVVRRFTVSIDARWNGDTGTLDERFEFSDGEKQRRIWTIRRAGPGRYAGTADDVVGTAEGLQAGNSIHWTYVLALPVDGRVYNVTMDDWMFLVDADTLLNRTAMKKFGFQVGEVTLAFRRRP